MILSMTINQAGVWIAAALGIVLIVSALGGLVLRTGRGHIDNAVTREVHREVPAVVAMALREVNVKLDGIRINQAELSAEVGRVRILETKIDNGLTTKVASIDKQQGDLAIQVAEIHGWLAQSRKWNGEDRRGE